MGYERLAARVEPLEKPEKGYLVKAPAVGVLEDGPEAGVHLSPLIGFVTLRILNKAFRVQLPHGVQGWVAERLVAGNGPVQYDQPLFRLTLGTGPAASAAEAAEKAEAGEAGLIAVTAPSEGVFYSRPKPEAPPYVDVGSTVSTGSVVGLVEVMKCFSQITYGGPGLPEKGTVAKVLVQQGAELKFGQKLFLVKPG
jgi:acetyl-CoA carboxylase biotin carboxyl carrier protein